MRLWVSVVSQIAAVQCIEFIEIVASSLAIQHDRYCISIFFSASCIETVSFFGRRRCFEEVGRGEERDEQIKHSSITASPENRAGFIVASCRLTMGKSSRRRICVMQLDRNVRELFLLLERAYCTRSMLNCVRNNESRLRYRSISVVLSLTASYCFCATLYASWAFFTKECQLVE